MAPRRCHAMAGLLSVWGQVIWEGPRSLMTALAWNSARTPWPAPAVTPPRSKSRAACERPRSSRLAARAPDTLLTRDRLAHWTGEAGDAAAAPITCGLLGACAVRPR